MKNKTDVLIFARHGETEAGILDKFVGLSDSPLTQKGQEQAQYLGQLGRKKSTTIIYSSPLQRCMVTAEIAAKISGARVVIVNDLREICYGDWEGKPRTVLQKLSEWQQREKNLFEFVHPGEYKGIKGESYELMYNRLVPHIQSFVENGIPSQLIIAHAGVIRCARKFFEQEQNFSDAKISNDKVYKVFWDKGHLETNVIDIYQSK